jgi:hypothetical protein
LGKAYEIKQNVIGNTLEDHWELGKHNENPLKTLGTQE